MHHQCDIFRTHVYRLRKGVTGSKRSSAHRLELCMTATWQRFLRTKKIIFIGPDVRSVEYKSEECLKESYIFRSTNAHELTGRRT